MKFVFLFLLIFAGSAQAETKLLLIGGGPRPAEAMKLFAREAGGPTAKIVVVPWASESVEGGKNIQKELLPYGGSVDVLPNPPLTEEAEEKMRQQLQSATGIFFAGGDQVKLMNVIRNENLKPELRSAYGHGVIFGGTSAGTAIMSERMITGDAASATEAPPIAEGLGLLPPAIITDQHFLVRQRFNRLATLVMKYPNTRGLGIDEGTSAYITENHFVRVIGPSQVLFFSSAASQAITVDYFKPGDSFRF